MRTLEWDFDRRELRMIDQRLLPAHFEINTYRDYHEVALAIRNMVVRGAPAIGATAGFGMALAASYSNASSVQDLKTRVKTGSRYIEGGPSNGSQPGLGFAADTLGNRSSICFSRGITPTGGR